MRLVAVGRNRKLTAATATDREREGGEERTDGDREREIIGVMIARAG